MIWKGSGTWGTRVHVALTGRYLRGMEFRWREDTQSLNTRAFAKKARIDLICGLGEIDRNVSSLQNFSRPLL